MPPKINTTELKCLAGTIRMHTQVLYIAGMGAVSAAGSTFAKTSAAINANISAYASFDYYDQAFNPIKVAKLPDDFFVAPQEHINLLSYSERLIKMALPSVAEACAQASMSKILPVVLALPEMAEPLLANLADDFNHLLQAVIHKAEPWAHLEYSRTLHRGRAAGIDAIDFVFNYLYDEKYEYVLLGGSDSHLHLSRLDHLNAHNRLLTDNQADGFAPGEGDCFLLLTRHPHLAHTRNGYAISLCRPGLADESGHLYSNLPYLGTALDTAFKIALNNATHCDGQLVSAIYSSMNGERYWSKEYGVAQLRNHGAFSAGASVHHPADAIGDLGAATAPLLIALAAEHLFTQQSAFCHLVTASSDYGRRAAVILKKIPL